MRRLTYSLILAIGLALAGCGGGNSGNAIVTPAILSISRYALPNGVTGNGMYLSAVDDAGVSYGSLGPIPQAQDFTGANPAAYWPTPSNCVTVPVLDSRVCSQTLVGRSPGGTVLIGYTYDANNSVGPGRGFAYDPATQQSHVLALTVSGVVPQFVVPTSVTDSGVVSGAVEYRNSTGPYTVKLFTYKLVDDSFELSDPGSPPPSDEVSSQNGGYFGRILPNYNTPAVYNGSNGSPFSVDSTDTGFYVDFVSNDGTVAVVERSWVGVSRSTPQEAKVWFPGRGTVSTYDLLKQSEPGVFSGTQMVTGSPFGHYIIILNTGVGNQIRLVHVK